MKKFKLYLAIVLAIIIPINVCAVEHDCEVEDVYISYEIDMVGSVHVKEAVVVEGSLNGNRKDIYYKNDALSPWEPGNVDFYESSIYNARGITISHVSARKIAKEDIGWNLLNGLYEDYQERDYASVGDTGVYTKEMLSNGYEIKTYSPNSSGYIVYYYEYYINQAVVIHNDVAEFFMNVFKLDTDDANNVHIQVTTAGVSSKDVFRAWAHGPLYGNISYISENKDEEGNPLYKGALLEMQNYKMGQEISVRLVFDKKLVPLLQDALNHSEMDALDKIDAVEEKNIKEANRTRMLIKITYYGSIGLGIAYMIGLVALWIRTYFKYDKEYDVGFDYDYYREFTGDYNVEVVDYLMKKDITTDAFSASVMNLIYKKNIDFIEDAADKKNITLVLKTRDKLNDTENKLVDLLFDTVGSEGKVTLKELEKFSSKYKTAEVFMKGYDAWKLSATKDGMAEDFFEEHTKATAIAVLYFILGIIITVILFACNVMILPFLVILGAIAYLIYVGTFKKWSKKGREHFLKWKAFKKFLLDFGSFKDKELPEVKLWDKYLVYATVLGVAAEVQKAMKVKISELNMDEDFIGPRYFTYSDFYLMNSITKSMAMAHTKSMSVISAQNASSNMSGGSFGGFSGGGSGGGGAGGGTF